MLRDVWLFRYITASQISRLHFGHIKLAQRRLRILADRALLDRFETSGASRAGFRTWWYRLSRAGARLVANAETLELESVSPPVRRPRTIRFLAHHSLSTDFRIWLREACTAAEFSYSFIPPYEEADQGAGRLSRIALSAPGHRRLLVPDGAFTLTHPSGRSALFALEVDCGTEPLTGRHASAIEAKFARYGAAFDARSEEQYAHLFPEAFDGFRVLCLVPSNRVEGFLHLAAKTDLAPLICIAESSLVKSQGDLTAPAWMTEPGGLPHALAE